jgi:U3 small nucleolar RNA-associated protein 7
MNPYNAVVGLGHSNGTVTQWSPNMSKPLVSLLCHRGPVTALAFESQGNQMITAGMDGKVKVFDLRKLSPLHTYFSKSPAKSLDVSQRGLLAVGQGSTVEIWKDALVSKQFKPYMKHHLPKGWQIQDFSFCPYEDSMGIGHSGGISSILVPGSGEANFDTYVANPFETIKQRREAEVHSLLDKLQPETIVLDPKQIGAVRRDPTEQHQMKREQALEANRAAAILAGKHVVLKNKMKGRNKPGRRQKRKQDNIISAKRPFIESQSREISAVAKKPKLSDDSVPRALKRFV